MWSCIKEILRYENSSCGAVGCGAALQLCERLVDHGGFHYLFEGIDVLELGVGVSLGVLMVHAGDFCKVFGFGTIPAYIRTVY